jgi:hypothetical protein
MASGYRGRRSCGTGRVRRWLFAHADRGSVNWVLDAFRLSLADQRRERCPVCLQGLRNGRQTDRAPVGSRHRHQRNG